MHSIVLINSEKNVLLPGFSVTFTEGSNFVCVCVCMCMCVCVMQLFVHLYTSIYTCNCEAERETQRERERVCNAVCSFGRPFIPSAIFYMFALSYG